MMTCPKCGGKCQTEETLDSPDNEVYRQKRCLNCGHKFFTLEFTVEYDEVFQKEWRTLVRPKKKGLRKYGGDIA